VPRTGVVVEAQPIEESLRDALRLLDRRHVAAVFDDDEARIRQGRRDLLVLGQRTPPILPPDHDQRRARDGGEERLRVGPVEKRLDLSAMLLGRRPHDHRLERCHKRRVIDPRLVDHRRQPLVGQGPHAFRKGKVDEDLSGYLLALPPRMDAGIEEREPPDALRREPDHFERRSGTHGMAYRDDLAVHEGKGGSRHVGDRVVLREVGDGHVDVGGKRTGLRRPDARVAEKTRKENDLQSRYRIRDKGFPGLHARKPKSEASGLF
jgi:hypothetical protein